MARTVRDAAILLGALTGVDAARSRDACEHRPLARRLHGCARRERLARRANRRRAKALRGISRGDRHAVGRRDRSHEAARRGHRRSSGHCDGGRDGRLRIRRADVRVQGRPQCVSRTARAKRDGAVARRCHRVQHEECRRASCAISGRRSCSSSQKKGPLTEKKYLDALAKNRRLMGARGHRRDDDEVQARRDRRADAGTGGVDRPRERRPERRRIVHVAGRGAPDIRTSRCRWDSCADCRSGCRSSVARGARRRC